jgi:hypothetical protein
MDLKGFQKAKIQQDHRSQKPIVLAAVALVFAAAIALGVALPLTVGKSSSPPAAYNELNPTGTIKTYYVGADALQWDYAPSRTNLCYHNKGDPYSKLIRTNYTKALYRQYTDETFKVSSTSANALGSPRL